MRIRTDMSTKESKILLVDDEPVITKTISHYLKLAGFTNILTENSPLNVVNIIGQYEPNILLLDISMPELDGLKILEQLSSRVIDDSLTVIMVTSSEEDYMKRKALILGACDFISKPVNPKELVARVESALLGRPNLDFILHSLPPKSTPSINGAHQINQSDTTPPQLL